jgi:hypothetical protein
MRCLVNWTRRHGGRSTLRQSPELDRSAGLRADGIRRCQDHRQILFDASWRDVGVARVRARSLFGRPNVTVWVAQFGRRLGLAPLP